MGLENLKSIFNEGVGNSNSQLGGRHVSSLDPNISLEGSPLGTVNYFGPSNSYFPALQNPIEGFTANFNQGGYSFGEGNLGNSQFLSTTSDFQTRIINVDTSNLTGNRLGFGNFESPVNTPELDDRIRQGLNFVSETIRSPLGQLFGDTVLGQGTMERFTDAVGTAQVGYQIFNSITNQTLGIDTITNMVGPISIEGGQINIGNAIPFRYEDTVWENRSSYADRKPDEVRGVYFQANADIDKAPSGRVPSSPPRTLKMESFGNVKHFQDPPVSPPLFTIGFQSPLESFQGPNINFNISKDFKDGVTEWKDGAVKKLSDLINPKGLISGQGGPIYPPSHTPPWKKDIDEWKDSLVSSAKEFFQDAMSFGGAAFSSPFSVVGGAIGKIGADFGKAAKGISKLTKKILDENPISIDIELPKIKLQNPFPMSSPQGYGGVAMEVPRNPRDPKLAANNIFPRKMVSPIDKTLSNDVEYTPNTPSTPYSELGKGQIHYGGTGIAGNVSPITFYYPNGPMDEKGGGDFMTNLPTSEGETIDEAYPENNDFLHIESPNDGYPLYFKDLRNDKYIIFRGYIEGLTENVSPTWTSENYIGRSEPAYIYERAERDITFTMKLFAQTAKELGRIYGKLNLLTSLCYPDYQPDPVSFPVDNEDAMPKMRMKPPLTKFRMGELFGNSNRELLGFLKTVTYSYPDNSPWEFKRGQRVPKHIISTITYQVIHMDTPQLGTPFYGFLGD